MARKDRNNSKVWEQAFQMFCFDMEPDYDLEAISIFWEEEDATGEVKNNYYDEAEKVLREEGKLK